ncbi:hypothetical protein [Alkalihalobacillus sp. 1P02AB]|uniref:hypothetical protein n=1 Tax=Alkalihalobacillus sp. 1P02AB TaxID=3132260 RepID=UPI0039A54A43
MKKYVLHFIESGLVILVLWVLFGFMSSLSRWNSLPIEGIHLAVIDRMNGNQIVFSPVVMLIMVVIACFIIHAISQGCLFLKNTKIRGKTVFVSFLLGVGLIFGCLMMVALIRQILDGFYLAAVQSLLLLIYIAYQYWFHHHPPIKRYIRKLRDERTHKVEKGSSALNGSDKS